MAWLTDTEYALKQIEPLSDIEVDIPLEDEYAYVMYPEYNWVYNKLNICETQNIVAYPHGIDHKVIKNLQHPLISKPIFNLKGMSVDVVYVDNIHNIQYRAGHMLMPYFEGQQYSTDLIVINGTQFPWEFTMSPIADNNGSFLYWKRSFPETEFIKNWIRKYLSRYTGIINVEYINSKILEVHLRGSFQFFDLYGGYEFLNELRMLYETGYWNHHFNDIKKHAQSHVLRIPKNSINENIVLNHTNIALLKQISFAYWMNDEGKKLIDNPINDPYTYVIAVANGYDENKCKEQLYLFKEELERQIDYEVNTNL